jgi:hypothetical protein
VTDDAEPKPIDWLELKVKYVTDPSMTQAQIAEIAGVAPSEVGMRAMREEWSKARRQHLADLERDALKAHRVTMAKMREKFVPRVFEALAEVVIELGQRMKRDARNEIEDPMTNATTVEEWTEDEPGRGSVTRKRTIRPARPDTDVAGALIDMARAMFGVAESSGKSAPSAIEDHERISALPTPQEASEMAIETMGFIKPEPPQLAAPDPRA